LALGYFGIGLFVAMRLTAAPDRQPPAQTPPDAGLDYREVNFQSTDDLDLAGWWVPGDDPSQAIMLVPGLAGDKSDRHVLETALVYAETGYSVLMIDLRGQGGSEGQRITMGYQEVRDVRGALAWLEEQGFKQSEVVIYGWSMGAATALRAAPGMGVAAVVADSAYADLPQILRERLPEASGLPSFFNPGVMMAAKFFLGLDPWAVRPKQDVRRLCEEGVPLMIIHATGDELVPFEHARRLKEACLKATFWQLEGYEHVGASAHPEYRQRLLGFLEETTFEGAG
jgi:uncharacterized protein